LITDTVWLFIDSERRLMKDEEYLVGNVGLAPVVVMSNHKHNDCRLRREPMGRRMLVRVWGSADVRSATILSIDFDIEPCRRDKLL